MAEHIACSRLALLLRLLVLLVIVIVVVAVILEGLVCFHLWRAENSRGTFAFAASLR